MELVVFMLVIGIVGAAAARWGTDSTRKIADDHRR